MLHAGPICRRYNSSRSRFFCGCKVVRVKCKAGDPKHPRIEKLAESQISILYFFFFCIVADKTCALFITEDLRSTFGRLRPTSSMNLTLRLSSSADPQSCLARVAPSGWASGQARSLCMCPHSDGQSGRTCGHARGSGQLLGMHTLHIPTVFIPLKVCPQSAVTGT
jgi:hypothetical protein